MDKLCFYVDFDVTKLRENGAVVRAFRTLKLICNELNFMCIAPGVWEFQGEEKDDLAAHALFITRFKQFEIFDKCEELLARFPDGTIEDCIEEERKADEKRKQRALKSRRVDKDRNPLSVSKSKKKAP